MSDDLVKRLKKWADGEAMAAYGEHLVDHPDEHEGSQISELIDTLTDRIEELEAKLREMALDCLAAEGQAAEAYQAQLAAEAKLAKTVEMALEECPFRDGTGS
jgi:outer membrane murein-binding lipoprotein Lpp